MSRLRPRSSPRAQSGVVLFIALIVMVALSIAGIALVRSVDTGMSVAANLGFRQASISPTTWAVEKAISAMFEAKTIVLDAVDVNKNYYPYRYEVKVAGKPEDALGVPFHLQGTTPVNYPGTFLKETDAAGNTIRYVIERMCID
jgi:Tfp pilus assembly protein PilX